MLHLSDIRPREAIPRAALAVLLAASISSAPGAPGAHLAEASVTAGAARLSTQSYASGSSQWEASAKASVAAYGDASVPQGVRVRRSGSRGLKVSWRPVAGARGYAVYRWDEAASRWRRAKVLPAKARSWRDAGLKPDVTRRYAVAACKGEGGKRAGRMSYWVEARPYSKGAKRVNPGKVTVPQSLEMAIGGAEDLSRHAKVAPSSFGRKVGAKGCKAFSRGVRLVSSDPSIVPSRDDGMLYAYRTGTCSVRAVAPNGNLSGPMTVTVRGHLPPGAFSEPGLPKVYDPELIDYLNARSEEIYGLAERLCEGWSVHYSWDVERSGDGALAFPPWMGEADRSDIAALFEDPRFDDTFRLTSLSLIGVSLRLTFYSAIADSVYTLDDGYRVFSYYGTENYPTPGNASPLAYGWWLGHPTDWFVNY